MRRFLLLLPFLLSACASDLAALRAKNPQAHDYASALAAEYLSFAESEAEQGYGISAEHFGKKGRDALEWKDIPPERPEDWGVKREEAALIRGTLPEMLQYTGEQTRRVVPQKAARARSLYDCWVVQASRRLSSDPAPCQEELGSLLAELETVALYEKDAP